MPRRSHAFATRTSNASASVVASTVRFAKPPRHPAIRGEIATSLRTHDQPSTAPKHGLAPSITAVCTRGPTNGPDTWSRMSPWPFRTRRA